MPPALPPPRVRTLQASAASRRKIGRVSGAGGRQERWAKCCSREVPQVLPRQLAEPVQAVAESAVTMQAVTMQAPAAGLVRERSSLVAAQRAAAQFLGPGAARRNPIAPRMWRLLKE